MALDPGYAATINNGSALLGNAETNLQVPTTASTLITAGANGTKVEEVRVDATTTSLAATTVAGLVYLFLYDGSTHHLFDQVAVSTITASATVAPFQAVVKYPNLVMKSGWVLKASQSIAGNASILKVSAFGADL